METKPKKGQPLDSHGSGQHRLDLDDHLKSNTPQQREKAQVRFEEAQLASPTPPPPPRTPQISSPDIQEMAAAADKLGVAVDRICEAMILVFGKISEVSDEAHGQTLALRSGMKWLVRVGVIQAVVCVLMILIMLMSYSAAVSARKTHVSQLEAVQEMVELTVRVDKLLKASEETKRKVEEVRRTADESPTIQLAVDPKEPGGAIVRIVPPKDAPATKASSPEAPVEIPIKMDSARRQDDGGRR